MLNAIIMKKIFILLVSFAITVFTSDVFAGNDSGNAPKTVSVTGTVIDKTNQEAIAGVLVKIEGTELEAYTDLDGKFTFNGLIPDTYKIKCSMISYTEISEEIDLDKTKNKLEIKLQNYSAE
jgi:hypothetical protein